MKNLFLISIIIFVSNQLHAQINQSVPENFLSRMISGGKAWKIQSYNRVQVSGEINNNPLELLIVKEHELKYLYPNKKERVVNFNLESGTVDPLLKTEDGNVYEVRFFNKPPVEVMRLRRILAPDKSSPYNEILYMH